MKKVSILAPLLLICLVPLLAQTPEEEAERRFLKFIESHPIETSHLCVPAGVYFTGDTLPVAGIVTDLFFRPTQEISQILKVSLVDTVGSVLKTLNFTNRNGAFGNSWRIPHHIPTGLYFLVAHTAYMQNFKEEQRDVQAIFIKNIWDDALTQSYVSLSENKMIKWYPEGGGLVAGHSQKVIITAPGGKGGSIRDGSDNIVAGFDLNNGIATVHFTPIKNKSYHLRISRTDGSQSSHRMDWEEADGTIKVSKIGSRYFINILTAGVSQPLYLILESNNQFQSMLPVELNEQGTATFALPAVSLNGNFHTAVLVDEALNIIAVRPFHTPATKLSHMTPVTGTSQSSMEIGIQSPVQWAGTITAAKEDPYLRTTSLANNLALSYGFAPLSKKLDPRCQNLTADDLLIYTTELFHAKWKSILQQSNASFHLKVPPELGIDIRGRISNELQAGSRLNFFQWEKKLSYQVDILNGAFYLPLTDFSGLQTFTYSAVDSMGVPQDTEVVFDSPKTYIRGVDYHHDPRMDSIIEKEIGLKRIIAQYASEERKSQLSLYESLESDRTFDMNDYLILNTFNEVVVDILTGVGISSHKGKKEIRITDPIDGTYDYRPAIIVNDRQLGDPDLLWSLPPIYLSEIKVLSSKQSLGVFGELGKYGILAIKLQNDSPKGLLSHPSDHRITIEGFLDTPSGSSSHNAPEFRNLLYNSADHFTEKSKWILRTSSETGDYKLLLQGLSEKGELLHSEATFSVDLPAKQ